MAELQNTIHLQNGYEKDARAYYPVLIVGAGAAGIGMGCQLKQQLGFDQFRIFDRQAGLGGTLEAWTSHCLLITDRSKAPGGSTAIQAL